MTFTKTPRIMVSALAIAFGTMAFSPTPVEAKSYKKHVKKMHKHHKKAAKHYYKNHYRPRSYHSPYRYHSPHRYKSQKYERESLQIFGTPGGGIGFSYSESKGRHPGYWY